MQKQLGKTLKIFIIVIFITSFIPMSNAQTVYFPPSANWELGYNETSAGSTYSITNERMYYDIEGGGFDGDSVYYVSDNSVDLRNISYIEIEWKAQFGAVSGAAVLGINESKATAGFTANVTRTSTFSTTTNRLDVSDYYGDFYIKAGGYTKEALFSDDINIWIYNITMFGFPDCWQWNATSVSTTSATLVGRLENSTNRSCNCGFWIGNQTTTEGNYEQNVTASGTYTEGQNFTKLVSSLSPGTYYYVRAWCDNGYNFNVSQNESYLLTLPQAPSNFQVSSIGASSLILTWTNASVSSNANHSVLVRYSTSGYPTSITSGTFGANESNYANVTIGNLGEETTYYFSAWTWINGSGSPTLEAYSSSYATTTNSTEGGVYNISIKYENETDGNNYPVDLSQYWGPHKLIIHYENEVDYVTFYNYGLIESSVVGDFSFNNSGNFTIEVNKSIRYMEFHWNDSGNRTYRCNRIIIPTSDSLNQTFYIRTNLPVYGEAVALPNQSLLTYTYSFLDETGQFTVENNAYATIFTYNSKGEYMQIHTEYFDASLQVHPWLVYQKKYFIGVYCDNINIERIGVCPTTDTLTVDIRIPYQGNITYNFLDVINLQIGWYDDGFYANYQDTTSTTNIVTFYVYYYSNDTYTGHSETQTVSNYNFTFTTAEGCNISISYYFEIVADLEGVGEGKLYNGTYTVQIPMISGYHMSISVSDLDALIEMMFGPSPLYNYDLPSQTPIRWTYILLFGLAFIVLVTFGKLNAFLGMMSCGLTLAVGTVLISGISWLLAIAVLLMILAIIGLIGGVERRQL